MLTLLSAPFCKFITSFRTDVFSCVFSDYIQLLCIYHCDLF